MAEIKDQPEKASTPVKTLLFYANPVALNRDAHRDLRLSIKSGDFGFARDTNSIPVAAVEFADTCRDYPIIFAGPDPDQLVPAVLLGLHNEENQYIAADNSWSHGYVPAFVRRYPFVLAEKPDTDEYTVCIDTDYAGFASKTDSEASADATSEPADTTAAVALFDAAGKETDYLKQTLDFLGKFQGHMVATRRFVKLLRELDLLIPKVIRSGSGDTPPLLSGFHVVDEEALRKLDAETLHQLMQSGALGWIYMHLISLRNISQLSVQDTTTA